MLPGVNVYDEPGGSNRVVSFKTTTSNRNKTLSGSGHISAACTGRIEGEFYFVMMQTEMIAFLFMIEINLCVPQ
jgi:hypothetical protein